LLPGWFVTWIKDGTEKVWKACFCCGWER